MALDRTYCCQEFVWNGSVYMQLWLLTALSSFLIKWTPCPSLPCAPFVCKCSFIVSPINLTHLKLFHNCCFPVYVICFLGSFTKFLIIRMEEWWRDLKRTQKCVVSSGLYRGGFLWFLENGFLFLTRRIERGCKFM